MNFLKKLWQNKDFRVLIWTCFNAIIVFVGTLLIAPKFAAYSPFLIPFLNIVTKRINTKFFGDLGTIKALDPVVAKILDIVKPLEPTPA